MSSKIEQLLYEYISFFKGKYLFLQHIKAFLRNFAYAFLQSRLFLYGNGHNVFDTLYLILDAINIFKQYVISRERGFCECKL